MNDVQEKPAAHDRRPSEVPHHPKVMTVAAIVTGAALLFMGAWFWQVMTSPGVLLSAENESAQDGGSDQLSSDADRLAEDAQKGDVGADTGKKGGPPEAPDVNDPVTPQWELSGYSILSVNGILQVGGTLTNTSNQALTGTVKAYVYTDGVPIATAKTEVENFQPGTSDQVNLVSDSEWEAGEKLIVLDFEPAKG
ncbi:MAG: hypothetical protein U0R64_08480 [Candidatus Nanopelagicales bacterium]